MTGVAGMRGDDTGGVSRGTTTAHNMTTTVAETKKILHTRQSTNQNSNTINTYVTNKSELLLVETKLTA